MGDLAEPQEEPDDAGVLGCLSGPERVQEGSDAASQVLDDTADLSDRPDQVAGVAEHVVEDLAEPACALLGGECLVEEVAEGIADLCDAITHRGQRVEQAIEGGDRPHGQGEEDRAQRRLGISEPR